MSLSEYRQIRMELRNQIFPNDFLGKRRYHRKHKTPFEKITARALQSLGIRFNSQCDLSPYIVDFLLYEWKIILEVDGYWHTANTAYLNQLGFKVKRIFNTDVSTFSLARQNLSKLFNEESTRKD